MPDGAPIGGGGLPGSGGAFLFAPGVLPVPRGLAAGPVQQLISQPISPLFNIGGAPITVLAGVFEGGLPIAGPVTQIFRGGSAPQPPTLFVATISPAGPIGTFLVGGEGGPIGAETFGGGALPIAAAAALEQRVSEIQPRTALVLPPALAFGGGEAAPIGAPPIGPPPAFGGGGVIGPSPQIGPQAPPSP